MALDWAGLKYNDVMDRFEVSRGTVSRWCRDIGPRPKHFILEEIARMCAVSPEWLIGGDDRPTAQSVDWRVSGMAA
jgi:hypothetical protein